MINLIWGAICVWVGSGLARMGPQRGEEGGVEGRREGAGRRKVKGKGGKNRGGDWKWRRRKIEWTEGEKGGRGRKMKEEDGRKERRRGAVIR